VAVRVGIRMQANCCMFIGIDTVKRPTDIHFSCSNLNQSMVVTF